MEDLKKQLLKYKADIVNVKNQSQKEVKQKQSEVEQLKSQIESLNRDILKR